MKVVFSYHGLYKNWTVLKFFIFLFDILEFFCITQQNQVIKKMLLKIKRERKNKNGERRLDKII
jgi:hypothetical protein